MCVCLENHVFVKKRGGGWGAEELGLKVFSTRPPVRRLPGVSFSWAHGVDKLTHWREKRGKRWVGKSNEEVPTCVALKKARRGGKVPG